MSRIPAAYDIYFGAHEREALGTQLARVESIDEMTGIMSVKYLTCPGGDSVVLFVNHMAFTPTYGIFSLPPPGTVVEVVQLNDKSRIGRPFMGYMKNYMGTDNPDTVKSEAGNTMQPMVPGEIYTLSDFGSSLKMLADGTVSIIDGGAGSVELDPGRNGIYVSSPYTVKNVANTSIMRFGAVQRKQATPLGNVEGLLDSLPGTTPYQEWRTTVYPSQVLGSSLRKINVQLGDIIDDSLVPVCNPLASGLFEQMNASGVAVTKMKLDCTGGYTQTLGLANQIVNVYDGLLGTVSESCLGARTASAAVSFGVTAPVVSLNSPVLNLSCATLGFASPILAVSAADVSVSGLSVNVVAPSINFNGGLMGVARVGDLAVSSVDSDPAFWGALETLGTAILAYVPPPGETSTTAVAMLGLLKAFFGVHIVSIQSKIITGSSTVKAGG